MKENENLSSQFATVGPNGVTVSMSLGSGTDDSCGHVCLKRKLCEDFNVCGAPNAKRLDVVTAVPDKDLAQCGFLMPGVQVTCPGAATIVGQDCLFETRLGAGVAHEQPSASFFPQGFGGGPLILDFTTGSVRRATRVDGPETTVTLPVSPNVRVSSETGPTLGQTGRDKGKRAMEDFRGLAVSADERPTRRRRVHSENSSVDSFDGFVPNVSQPTVPDDSGHVGCSNDTEGQAQRFQPPSAAQQVPDSAAFSCSPNVPTTSQNSGTTSFVTPMEGVSDFGGPSNSRRNPRRRRSRQQNAGPSVARSPIRTNASARLGPPAEYRAFGSCACVCARCHAQFWFEERLSTSTRRTGPLYNRCCHAGKVRLFTPRQYPEYIKQLFSDNHFMSNIRAYNQMFAMTSLGANIDDSVNVGRGPYVFKVSGQPYHQIGKLCPDQGNDPRFLQLYIYDTDHEVDNRLGHFRDGPEPRLRRDVVEGLIQVLDEHNALVQLFRTARDKLREADVPEFKVRLFSVVGSAQYELPTADCIGAIVFEDGPESESEFDILIDTDSTDRDEDKRVTMNAYYAYMIHDRLDRQMAEKGKQAVVSTGTSDATQAEEQALQRSAEKGKAPAVEQEELDLMDIKPTDLDKPIEVRAYRRWTSKNVPDPNPTGLCYILLDRKGSAIQANVQLWDMRLFEGRLQVGGCYKIERFGFKRTDNWQRTLNNPITLLFGRYTQVTPIEDQGFPEHYFNFIAYNEIGQRADTRDYTLTDYIGIIRDIGQIREFGDPTTNRVLRRNIDVQNLNGNVLTFTIWNEMAMDFPLQLLSELSRPVIIAVSSCWARRFGGGLQLSATPATHYYLNPNIEEAERIRQMYTDMMLPIPPLQIPVPGTHQLEQPGARHLSQLNELMQAGPESVVQRFSVEAVILNIDQQMGWYINRCRTCGNKIADEMSHRHCQQPGIRPIPNYSYCFKMILADGTGNVPVTCFSPEADSLLLSNVTELLSYIPDPDPYVIPDIIQDLQNTTHVFHLRLARGSRRGFPRFILEGAEDVPLPPLPEATEQTEEPPLTAATESQMRTPIVTDIGASTSTESPSQTPAATELPSSSLTPPPLTDEPVERARDTVEIRSTTVQRQLFPETETNVASTDIENSPASQAAATVEPAMLSPSTSPTQAPIIAEHPTGGPTPLPETAEPTDPAIAETQPAERRAQSLNEEGISLDAQGARAIDKATEESSAHADKKQKLD
ncbi:helitron helicase-like domain-containing protein [Artemisia annua]|uniref:Helitron helicase-like domain-containing protein n=1 Tax=Artemisia annua TaxID=35608 RepID=A0A2U1PR57_ARTAN|nr:helitron helicase-like domain-containing protein [Artemisia annua]